MVIKTFKKIWPILILVILELILSYWNYIPGTFFLGWDNLFPEMNFGVNFRRIFYSVWQEYRGLGLLDGMSFAANIPHYFFIRLLSFILPLNILRYFFFFLMHFLGGLGAYWLLRKHFNQNKIIALFSALFYQYNLGAAQMFYAPYELFAVHFAFLPWVFYFALQFLYKAGKKNLALFVLFSFFAVPQAHVPTVFIVFAFALAILFVSYLLEKGKSAIKKVLVLLAITFCINAYWGLPFAYNVLVNREAAAESKINLMATDDIYLLSKKYANLGNVAQLKGYMFDSVNIWADGQKEAMLMRWQEYVNEPFFQAFAYFFFLLAVVGIAKSVKEKNRKYYPFIIMFLFGFLTLWLGVLIFERFALFKQVFRFTFTKFSILYFFSFSIFLAEGAQFLVGHFKKERMAALLFAIALFAYSFPSFQGYFLYPRLKLQIPQEYFKLVEFFNKQKASERIALLPQPSFWGWTQNKWGYKGSGFIWYGLPQAVMDGAFYPWSRNNENYYWELARAISRNDINLFQAVLNKYNIGWAVFDKSVIYKESPGAINYEAIARLLNKSSAVVLKRRFGKIFVYKVNLRSGAGKFVYLAQDLPQINSYKWGDYDRAYAEYGDYYTRLAGNIGAAAWSRIFNSRTRENKHNNTNSLHQNYCPKKSNCKIVHSSFLPTLRDKDQLIAQQIKVPTKPKLITGNLSLSILEISGVTTEPAKNTWPALSKIFDIRSSSLAENTDFLDANITRNDIIINNSNIANRSQIVYYPFRSLFSGRGSQDLKVKIIDKGEYFVFKAQIPKELAGGRLAFPAIEKEEISELALLGRGSGGIRLPHIKIKNGNFKVQVPKIKGYYSYESKNLEGKPLGDIYLPNLKHKIGYLIGIKAKNIKGRPLKFWIENLTAKRADQQVFLEKASKRHWEYFIQPPMAEDGVGYSLHFDNEPIGDEERINKLEQVTVNPIPYKFLSRLKIVKSSKLKAQSSKKQVKSQNLSVKHSNPSVYYVSLNQNIKASNQQNTLILSQAYDKGWKAYWIHDSGLAIYEWVKKAFPFVFGEPVGEHMLVNNWANGWNIPYSRFTIPDSRIAIVYLPQYLQYFGFLLLIITPLVVVKLGDGRV